MAMRWFGGTPVTVEDPTTGAWMPHDTGSVWDAAEEGTRYDEVYDRNAALLPAGDLFTDEYGYVPLFGIDTDPATEVVWVDFTGGLGRRVRLECRDRAAYRLSEADKDAPEGVAGLDADRRLDLARIPNLPASKVTGGEFAPERIPDLSHVYVPVSGTTLGDPARHDETRLRSFRAALGDVEHAPVDILTVGDSITEGSGTTAGRRWSDQVTRMLRRSYQPEGVAGGEGYVPAFYHAPSVEDRWSGTYTEREDLGGLGIRVAQVDGGDQVSITLPSCTGVDIRYMTGSAGGTWEWSVGGQSGSVDSNGTLAGGNTEQVRGLARGQHTLTITTPGGACFLEGVAVYDQDETKGIRVHEGGHGGHTTGDFLTTTRWLQSVDPVQPALIIVGLGINDYRQGVAPSTMRENLEDILQRLRARCDTEPSVVVSIGYETVERDQAVAQWSAYRQAIIDMAQADGRITLWDHQVATGTPLDGDPFGMYADNLHPNARGYGALGQSLHGLLHGVAS